MIPKLRSSNLYTMSSTTRHPRQLYLLFFAEMWERFSFYGMKALLLAYMVTQLAYEEEKGYGILGAYVALVYTMPVFGGMLADRILGYRKAVILGGVLMSVGHLVLAVEHEMAFYAGMAFIISGNGFFKPNISSMVGALYPPNDPRRDSGFSLFYMGINLGAALGGTLCGWIGQNYNWHYGFGLAGIFMVLGLVVFYVGQKSLGTVGLPPNGADQLKVGGFVTREWIVYAGAVLIVPVIMSLLNLYEVMDPIMLVFAVVSLVYLVWEAFRLDLAARNQLLAATLMISFSVLFWAFYEQNAGALNLFAMRNVNLHVAGVDLPALSVNNFLPPAWVIALSPVFAWLWSALNRKNLEPSTPLKFSLSFVAVGLGFLVFFAGTELAENGKIPLLMFVMGYFFLISGELCLSPIGLSMVTKLAPERMVGMVMGIWFLASALGDFLSTKIGKMMTVPAEVVNDPVQSLPYYSSILQQIGYVSIGTGVLLFFTVPLIKRWMGTVK